MRIDLIERKQWIPTDLDTVWNFFATPLNLNEMTPKDLHFEILTDLKGKKMYKGMIINYKIQPFPLVKFRWTTEITQCEEGKYFIDEQRFGPYSFWHHQHHFEQAEGGVWMRDLVHYGLPLGPLGLLAKEIFVRKKLESIFDYRREKIEQLFG
jgi:ligand-binding SRPBCC domain-containing protein